MTQRRRIKVCAILSHDPKLTRGEPRSNVDHRHSHLAVLGDQAQRLGLGC
jgi:hypothetical protein